MQAWCLKLLEYSFYLFLVLGALKHSFTTKEIDHKSFTFEEINLDKNKAYNKNRFENVVDTLIIKEIQAVVLENDKNKF
jgi:hypothetical protein